MSEAAEASQFAPPTQQMQPVERPERPTLEDQATVT